MPRFCTFIKTDGEPCQMRPGIASTLCFAHDPDRATEAKTARQLGGKHRKRQRIASEAFDFEGIESARVVAQLLDTAVVDVMLHTSSLSRARTLAYIAQVIQRFHEYVATHTLPASPVADIATGPTTPPAGVVLTPAHSNVNDPPSTASAEDEADDAEDEEAP